MFYDWIEWQTFNLYIQVKDAILSKVSEEAPVKFCNETKYFNA